MCAWCNVLFQLEDTVSLVKRIEKTGVAAIAVHGRLEVCAKRVFSDAFFFCLVRASLYLNFCCCQDERGATAAPAPLWLYTGRRWECVHTCHCQVRLYPTLLLCHNNSKYSWNGNWLFLISFTCAIQLVSLVCVVICVFSWSVYL